MAVCQLAFWGSPSPGGLNNSEDNTLASLIGQAYSWGTWRNPRVFTTQCVVYGDSMTGLCMYLDGNSSGSQEKPGSPLETAQLSPSPGQRVLEAQFWFSTLQERMATGLANNWRLLSSLRPSPPAFHPTSDTLPGPLDACLLPGPKANGACQAATLHFQGSTTPWLFLVA